MNPSGWIELSIDSSSLTLAGKLSSVFGNFLNRSVKSVQESLELLNLKF
jgi:predicted phage tail protein